MQIQTLDGPHTTKEASKRPEAPKPRWIEVGSVSDFPRDGGAAVKVGDVQIAVFNFASRGEWYACQNMCPHKNALVLSRGILGDVNDTPKIACPLHKKTFSLKSGECLSGEDYSVKTFPIQIDAGKVLVQVPPETQLDALLSTKLHTIEQEKLSACAACSVQQEAKTL